MEAVWSFVDLSRRHLPPHDPKAAAHIAVDDDVLEKAEVSLERQSQRQDDASGQGEGEEWHGARAILAKAAVGAVKPLSEA
jgi:hypothetical protein